MTSATSNAAAERAGAHRTPVQLRVLNMFRVYSGMTDENLLMVLNDAERGAGIRPTSPSGARSRRSELSKPNMERIAEMMREEFSNGGITPGYVSDLLGEEEGRNVVDPFRRRLRAEGFRSPLWDSGRREKTARGFQAIVWEEVQ